MNVLTFKGGKKRGETFSNTTWENLIFPTQKVLIIYLAHLINYVYYFSFH